ncbi:pseudouridine synthase [Agrobacterium tumefaciens]|nr:pseudouridine synthase [Agrobacterium tumefaciens]
MKNHHGKQGGSRVTLSRAMSKIGYCSRTQAETLINEGRVRVNGSRATDCRLWIDLDLDVMAVDGVQVRAAAKSYIMLNKPRGLITTRDDPGGRDTVFSCLRDLNPSHISPVGRLDEASEGLLLFTNDTVLAQRLLDPETNVKKIYHVRVSGKPTESDIRHIMSGIQDRGETLTASSARILRFVEKNGWLEVELREGRNRQIRRMVEALGFECQRLVRVGIDTLSLGSLNKGEYRYLSEVEIGTLGRRVGLPIVDFGEMDGKR